MLKLTPSISPFFFYRHGVRVLKAALRTDAPAIFPLEFMFTIPYFFSPMLKQRHFTCAAQCPLIALLGLFYEFVFHLPGQIFQLLKFFVFVAHF